MLAALTLLGCPNPADSDAGETEGEVCDADLDQVRAEILVPQCTSEFCHDADAPAAGLDFTRSSAGIAAQLVHVPSSVCADWVRVVPGDPKRSILLAKLLDPPPCGEPMPIDGELSDYEIACISRWIDEAASACETCGGTLCVDVESDPAHCGGCDESCAPGQLCSAGSCVDDPGALMN